MDHDCASRRGFLDRGSRGTGRRSVSTIRRASTWTVQKPSHNIDAHRPIVRSGSRAEFAGMSAACPLLKVKQNSRIVTPAKFVPSYPICAVSLLRIAGAGAPSSVPCSLYPSNKLPIQQKGAARAERIINARLQKRTRSQIEASASHQRRKAHTSGQRDFSKINPAPCRAGSEMSCKQPRSDEPTLPNYTA